jgi:DNA polymerase-3 subunit gamma/tau
VLDEWPEAADLRRFADTLSPEQVQLFYQIATIGRSELGLAPDEYAGFTMTLLRMLAFEPAPNGGGGGGVTPAGRSSVPAAGAKRTGAPVAAAAAAAPQARTSDAPAATTVAIAPRVAPVAKPEPAPVQPQAVPEPAVSPEPAPEIQAAPVDAAVTPLSVAAASTSAESTANVDSPVASIGQQDNAAPADDSSTQTESAPRRAGGASAALDVLRNAGLKVSTGSRPASAAPASATPAAPAKPAAPRVAVRVPTPDPARRAAAAAQQENAARTQTPRAAQPQGASGVPPWDDIPPDDYMPASSDDAFFAASDDNFIPVFDSGPDDMLVGRGNAPATPVATAAPVVDIRTLPPAVPLDAIGVEGDWPALAVTLPLKGISYQLAFNSELMAVEGKTLKLNVAVQLYTESAQVAKLKAALAERLGSEIDVQVEVGPVRRTAAVLDSIERAKRQQEAEREIGADPFVQSLIREFGASIVPGSVRPLAPGAEGGQSAAGH